MGYDMAGFEVVGVDIKPQPRYPFTFIQSDIFQIPEGFFREFDAIHVSPPCQGYTEIRHAPGTKGAPRLIPAVRTMLRFLGIPYVIENVEGARWDMFNPTMLCGSMFGLGAQGFELQRHRLFETSFRLPKIECQHSERGVIGIYGGHARNRSAKHGGRGTQDSWIGGHRQAASEALGINWMTLSEMSEAIPPTYTKWIGNHLINHISNRGKML
jgi:DNA (cytosine-5)-methyltransferase 1